MVLDGNGSNGDIHRCQDYPRVLKNVWQNWQAFRAGHGWNLDPLPQRLSREFQPGHFWGKIPKILFSLLLNELANLWQIQKHLILGAIWPKNQAVLNQVRNDYLLRNRRSLQSNDNSCRQGRRQKSQKKVLCFRFPKLNHRDKRLRNKKKRRARNCQGFLGRNFWSISQRKWLKESLPGLCRNRWEMAESNNSQGPRNERQINPRTFVPTEGNVLKHFRLLF